jgi:hypothetical protein
MIFHDFSCKLKGRVTKMCASLSGRVISIYVKYYGGPSIFLQQEGEGLLKICRSKLKCTSPPPTLIIDRSLNSNQCTWHLLFLNL